MFGRQVTALAPQYQVMTWDQRGHGGTRAAGAFTYWDPDRVRALVLIDSQAGREDPANAPGYEQLHQA